MMSYLYLFIMFSGVMVGYIILAKKMGIIDKPNERSSHKKPTVRGGGIIFPIAVLLWAFLFEQTDWYFVSAVLLMGIIGFLDDRYSLSQLPRLIIQSLGVLLVLVEMGLLALPLFYAGIAFILITGWLNTFNFMDGINGISVLYAVAILIGVYLFKDSIPEIQLSLIYTIGLSLLIFGWFNVRKNALAFAGDVGSLTMGLIMAYLVSTLILSTGRWEFILFFSVYGIDSVLTIFHRLIKKENIFEAHRTHLYQYLANEVRVPHLVVSAIYSLLQFSIILGLYSLSSEYWVIYAISVLLILSLIYVGVKSFIFYKYRIPRSV
jgi:UDP-N-acetylmuramyl pentapeptide phosphotransferase/UDP-N-acetylglucosamine-1-phosphate transferase|tara:strand:- start:344 stop:1306 length:963 start_codon:yes stop_codon:yes gene_type:complete